MDTWVNRLYDHSLGLVLKTIFSLPKLSQRKKQINIYSSNKSIEADEQDIWTSPLTFTQLRRRIFRRKAKSTLFRFITKLFCQAIIM